MHKQLCKEVDGPHAGKEYAPAPYSKVQPLLQMQHLGAEYCTDTQRLQHPSPIIITTLGAKLWEIQRGTCSSASFSFS